MIRFLRLWLLFGIGYAVIGYLFVAGLYLCALAGWSDGPSSGMISTHIPETAQEVYAFGPLGSAWMRQHLFLAPGKPPWISRNPSPEETEIYSKNLEEYYQHVKQSESRRCLIYIAWISIFSFGITGLFVFFRPKQIEQSGPDNPRPCGTFGLSPADSASRAGARPKASGGI